MIYRLRLRISFCLAVLSCLVLLPAAANASSEAFERTWGKNVDAANPSTGFEICKVAADCQTGTSGGLGGELNYPQGVATDGAGNVYVAEEVNHRVQEFGSNGQFIRAWGKDVDAANPSTGFEICTVAANCKAGVGGGLGGELAAPTGVATDASGHVYVTDSSMLCGATCEINYRVQKFDSNGNFMRTWGKDVDATTAGTGFEICTVAASCQAGTRGSLGGEFDGAPGIAADSAGNVYAAETGSQYGGNNRVQKFDSNGNFMRAWGKNVDATTAGTGFEICTTAANCQAGTAGALGGELTGPAYVAPDGSGHVYVTESYNNRVQRFDTDGNFQRLWGEDVDAANPSKRFEICTVAANCKVGLNGDYLGWAPVGGALWYPNGVGIDGSGNVYVADTDNSRVQEFDTDGNFQRTWGKDVDATTAGTGFETCTVSANCKQGVAGVLGGELYSPVGLATDVSGRVYVADSQAYRVQRYSTAVTVLPASAQPGAGRLVFGNAASLAADDDNYFTVKARSGETTVSWIATFDAIPNALQSLTFTYTGKNSAACTQKLKIYNYKTAAYVTLDSRAVGTTEQTITADVAGLPGQFSDYVSNGTGPGQVKIKVSCNGQVTSYGDLAQLAYAPS
jgi:sugar lactone lactonase YvrE